jgi:guanine deaminase
VATSSTGGGSVQAARRRLLALISAQLATTSFLGTVTPATATLTGAAQADLPLPTALTHEAAVAFAFAQRDLATSWGDQPFGAVVVQAGTIVGEGPSRVVLNGDPTAHAEMEAVRDASRRLGTRDLSGCVVYATSRPCRMCDAALGWARVTRVYIGSDGADAGPPGSGIC